MSEAQAKLERVAVHLRQAKRVALSADDVAEFWTLAQSLDAIKRAQRSIRTEEKQARRERRKAA